MNGFIVVGSVISFHQPVKTDDSCQGQGSRQQTVADSRRRPGHPGGKIDQEFIRDIPRDEDDVSIVKSIIALAQNMRIDVLAEGVETGEQIGFLKREGCSFVQGYYLSHPKPAPEIPGLAIFPLD